MHCLNPYFGSVSGVSHPLPFPCGQCAICRSQSAMTWKLRCELEAIECNGNFAFVTLTYSDAFLPSNQDLVPSHLSSFLKRLRKDLTYPIRYFACGEYGSLRGRPHYHLILFGLKECDYDKVFKNWHFADLTRYSRGIDVQKGNHESLGYVSGYVAKKQSVMKYVLDNKVPPFHRCSLGLGLRGLLKITLGRYQPYILDSKGKNRYIGRYLRNKLASFNNVLEEIKQLGIEDLALKMVNILNSVDLEKALYLTPKVLIWRHEEKLLLIWRYFFAGYHSDFFSKQKLLRKRLDL